MKLFKTIFITFIVFGMIACGGAPTEESEGEGGTNMEEASESEDSNYDNMVQIELGAYDIEASIYVPDESKGKAEVGTTDWGSVTINVGKNFGIELVPFGMTIEEKKAELEGDLVYAIEYIKETPESIYYSKTVKDGEMEPEYHFFANKEINGDIVEVKNIEDGMYKKSAIELMMKSARSLQ